MSLALPLSLPLATLTSRIRQHTEAKRVIAVGNLNDISNVIRDTEVGSYPPSHVLHLVNADRALHLLRFLSFFLDGLMTHPSFATHPLIYPHARRRVEEATLLSYHLDAAEPKRLHEPVRA